MMIIIIIVSNEKLFIIVINIIKNTSNLFLMAPYPQLALQTGPADRVEAYLALLLPRLSTLQSDFFCLAVSSGDFGFFFVLLCYFIY